MDPLTVPSNRTGWSLCCSNPWSSVLVPKHPPHTHTHTSTMGLHPEETPFPNGFSIESYRAVFVCSIPGRTRRHLSNKVVIIVVGRSVGMKRNGHFFRLVCFSGSYVQVVRYKGDFLFALPSSSFQCGHSVRRILLSRVDWDRDMNKDDKLLFVFFVW